MAVILMKALSVFNKRTAARLQQYPDLRSQYNVSENLRTITIVLPVCAASAIFITSFYVAGVIGFKFGHPGNTIMLYVLTEGALLLPYSALVFPLIFDRLIKHSANANKVGLEVHMALDVKDSNHHFAAMAHAWDATFTARERRASA
ncbi:hypothetical protein Q1695_006962 [Nippostrongylus brasiliensis]|nr:hypothetical protein Q1695_006962 [Nippostrongylus brasiliensis]